MVYYLFLDESGDHGLGRVDESFPVFILCGILISHDDYVALGNKIVQIKSKFWPGKKAILHSSDIRKCENEFQILFDLEIKKDFYKMINDCMSMPVYSIIASAVDKRKFVEKYGPLGKDIYEISLAFILERAVFCLDRIADPNKSLRLIIEKRGKREDKNLLSQFHKLRDKGTAFVSSDRIRALSTSVKFYSKEEDKIGLQLADLAAYPIARQIIDPNRANPSFELIKPRFYQEKGKMFGLKIVP